MPNPPLNPADLAWSDLSEEDQVARQIWAVLIQNPIFQQLVGGNRLLTSSFKAANRQLQSLTVTARKTFDLNTLYLIARLAETLETPQAVQQSVNNAISALKT